MSSDTPAEPRAGDAGGSPLKAYLAGGVTIGVLLAYAVLIAIMWDKVGEGDVAWSRRVLLFSGVEAIAFAAVGWLFGREIHRGQAEKATTASREAGKAISKGQALAEAVREASGRPEVRGLEGVAGPSPAKSQVDSLAGLANRLFPPGER